MKAFIYNLLSKGLVILFLLALAAGYYYRTELFPQFFGSEATQVDAAPATSESPDRSEPATVAVPLPAMPAASSEPALAPVEPGNTPVEPQPDSAPVADAAAPQWPEAATSDGAADSPAAEVASNAAAPLQQARNAYWAGDMDGAVAAYQQAAASRPGDPDVHGELGNIYFAQGNWEQAAAAYLAAGQALLDRGERAAAEHLVVVLQGLNQAHARSLADALAQQPGGDRQ